MRRERGFQASRLAVFQRSAERSLEAEVGGGVGFNGFMIPDHVPRMIGDSNWSHRGRAYTIGYMKAMLDVLNRNGS